jgi:beta-glucanase (GH16 family)
VARHLLFAFMSCFATLGFTAACADPIPQEGWKPVLDWSAGRPFDTSKWTFEKGFLRNEELQYYAEQSAGNFQITPTGLVFVARSERVTNADYRKGAGNWRESRPEAEFTSASIVSKDAWENVKIEIVASVRGGKGAWPAIWMRGANTRGFSEVDLMEQLGREPDVVHATVHYGDTFFSRIEKSADRAIPGLQGKDVTYSAELKPDKLSVSVDGARMMEMERSRSQPGVRALHQPFNLAINLALGGAWAGPVDKEALPATMTIKSIRIWEWQSGPEKRDVTASKE